MPLYVLALLDRAPRTRPGRGLSGAIAIRRVPGGFAAVERRADVPPLAFAPLRAHEQAVARLAARVPAILPVRFGTLLGADELDEALDGREEEIDEAFALVRRRVQFTWRASLRRNARKQTAAPAAGGATSGVEYLRRAARAARPTPPSAFRSLTPLRALAVTERYAPATPLLPGALYHLVERVGVDTYESAARRISGVSPALTMSGPFPPYAFVPELL